MSFSYYANHADVVDQDFVKKTCPKEYAALMATFTVEHPLEELAQYDGEDSTAESKAALQKLIDAFHKKTKLYLYLVYNQAEQAGDELDGVGWAVGGVYRRTPAGNKYSKRIKRLFWTTCG